MEIEKKRHGKWKETRGQEEQVIHSDLRTFKGDGLVDSIWKKGYGRGILS